MNLDYVSLANALVVFMFIASIILFVISLILYTVSLRAVLRLETIIRLVAQENGIDVEKYEQEALEQEQNENS